MAAKLTAIGFIAVAVISCVYWSNAETPKKRTAPVKLPEFTVRGFEEEYEGGKGNVYLGVPYVKPPVGDLRLEKPVPLEPSNKVIDAVEYSPTCYMQEDFRRFVDHSEDCLYLNIITPAKPPPPEGFPVIFWVHGGGFIYGGTVRYGYKAYIRDYAVRDVIYVNFNYRLAFYGFVTTNSSVLPGNLGLWDQSEALKFVKRNIKAFGGNPNKITVGGHSAGGVSSNSLAISPVTRDLFQNSIQQSGGTYEPWAFRPDIVDFSKSVAKGIGCPQTDDVALKKCLKEKGDPETIWAELRNYDFASEDAAFCPWSPILDAEYYGGKTIPQLLEEAPIKPVLFIIDSGEGLLQTLRTPNDVTFVFAYTYGLEPKDAHLYTRDNFTRDLERLYLNEKRAPPETIEQAKTDILYNFVDAEYDPSDPVYYWKKFTDVASHTLYEYGMWLSIRKRLELGWKDQYVLLFDYVRPEDIERIRYRAAPHGYEYFWISDTSIYYELDYPFTAYEQKFLNTWVENFDHFAHHGKPKSNWPAVRDPETIEYLGILQDKIAVEDTFFEHLKYWDRTFKKYNLLATNVNKEPLYTQPRRDQPAGQKTEL
uniref:Carboxylic ester hydrolase n=1 Tax=Panagrellus redivivus TaxID=6233 RepID=A0A7E4VT12_PANRE